MWKSEFRQNYRTISRPQFHLSLLGSLASLRTYRHLAAKVGKSKGGGKQWQTIPKNLPRMQCARAIPFTWLGSGSCQLILCHVLRNSFPLFYVHFFFFNFMLFVGRQLVGSTKDFHLLPEVMSSLWRSYSFTSCCLNTAPKH